MITFYEYDDRKQQNSVFFMFFFQVFLSNINIMYFQNGDMIIYYMYWAAPEKHLK